jgi:hypothetical protein
MSEPLIRLLAELPTAQPDPARAERLRVLCRTQIARRAPRAGPNPAAGGSTMQVWPRLIAVLGIAYLIEVIVQTLRVYGVL